MRPEVDLSDDAWIEFLALFDEPEYSPRDGIKARAALARQLEAALRRHVDTHAPIDDRIRLGFDMWSASGQCGADQLAWLMASQLDERPTDTHALDLYIEATVGRGYANRGRDLRAVAAHGAHSEAGRLRAYQAVIDAFVAMAEHLEGSATEVQLAEALRGAEAQLGATRAQNAGIDVAAIVTHCRAHWGWWSAAEERQPDWLAWCR
jgi:hypothetical protein